LNFSLNTLLDSGRMLSRCDRAKS